MKERVEKVRTIERGSRKEGWRGEEIQKMWGTIRDSAFTNTF